MADDTVNPIEAGRAALDQERWDAGAGKRRQQKIKDTLSDIISFPGNIQEGTGIYGLDAGKIVSGVGGFLKEQDEANRISNERFNSNERLAEYKDDLRKAAVRFVQVPTTQNKKIYNELLKGYNNEIKYLESLGVDYTGERFEPLTDKDSVPSALLQTSKTEAKGTKEPTQGQLNKLKIMEDKLAKDDFAVSSEGVQLASDTAAVIAALNAAGITPTQDAIAAALAAGGGDGGGGGGGGTQRSYRLLTEQQTAGFANPMAQDLIGRELTTEEIARTTQSVNLQAKANPTITTTSGTTTTQTGGIDERQIVKEELQLNPEYATYQQATTYFDTMLSALRGPAGGGI